MAALGGGSPEAVRDIRNLVHKLAGSAPTFGFAALGEAARLAERACDAALAGGGEVPLLAVRAAVDVIKTQARFGEETPSVSSVASFPPASLSGRVLVVEDEPSQALFAQVVLTKAGLDVVVESDPVRVGGRLAEIAPDLVFLDMNMPGLNGEDVVRQIRARGDALASVPIVILSGEEDPERQQAAISVGAEGFITKPVGPAALIDAARRFMKED